MWETGVWWRSRGIEGRHMGKWTLGARSEGGEGGVKKEGLEEGVHRLGVDVQARWGDG
jgi:hypothetical protein